MKVYIGHTTSGKMHDACVREGFGDVCQPDQLPPRKFGWFYDSGAFCDWRNDRPFNGKAFMRGVEWIACPETRKERDVGVQAPDFIVIPDAVGDREETLLMANRWGPRLCGVAPLYLALQDGMTDKDMERYVHRPWVDGFFLGGTNDWKVVHMSRIIRTAHVLGLPCHVGRVGTKRKLRQAKVAGANSIDSSFPLWTWARFNTFVEEVGNPLLWQLQILYPAGDGGEA
jgi:hypothetical protein